MAQLSASKGCVWIERLKGGPGSMGIAETIGVALRNLWANKLRTALSVLGIVIGVASVITMISAGSSAQKQITSDISALGSNMIMVTPNLKPGAKGRSYQHLLTMSLADQIQAAAPAVSAVSPVAQVDNWHHACVHKDRKHPNCAGPRPRSVGGRRSRPLYCARFRGGFRPVRPGRPGRTASGFGVGGSSSHLHRSGRD